jgi:hypothetical protein
VPITHVVVDLEREEELQRPAPATPES